MTAIGLLGLWSPRALAGPPPADAPAEEQPEPSTPTGPGETGSSLTSEPDGVALEPEPDADGLPYEQPEERDPYEGLPPEGRATNPALPYIDRDLLTPRQRGAGRGTAQVTISQIGEDKFLDFALSTRLRLGDKWQIAPRLPLRILIDDDPPESDDVIRTEDWDEVSDFARLLRYVQYGRVGDPFVFRYGELNGVTIGHGSLVNRYHNTVDIDHYQGGIYVVGDTGLTGGEIVLDNVLDPELFVGRAYVRPFSYFDSWPLFAEKLKIGVTAGADFKAPLSIDQSAGKLFSHPDRSPVVLADEIAGLFAVDIEVPVLSKAHLDIVPYLDVATVDGKGSGVHVGTYFNIRFDKDSRLRTRLEYRFLGKGYEPGWVSPFYEIERYSFRGGAPKLGWLRNGGAKAQSGFYLETDLAITRFLRYGFIFAANGSDRGSDLLMRLRLPRLGPVSLTLFFARLGFDGIDNLFTADQTVWGTNVRVMIGSTFFIRAKVVNEWWLKHNAKGEGSGFETTTNFDLGVGLHIRF